MTTAGDPEIDAMAAVSAALSGLDDDEARRRVLEWASKRYGVRLVGAPSGGGAAAAEGAADAADYKHFADLFDAANARSAADRALVGGYWFQVVKGQETFVSQDVNNELKNVGRGIPNVTDALSSLEARKPAAHVRQVSKTGKSTQARKTYKLTSAGVRAVERMLGRGASQAEGENDTDAAG